jgi:hypothetical protein
MSTARLIIRYYSLLDHHQDENEIGINRPSPIFPLESPNTHNYIFTITSPFTIHIHIHPGITSPQRQRRRRLHQQLQHQQHQQQREQDQHQQRHTHQRIQHRAKQRITPHTPAETPKRHKPEYHIPLPPRSRVGSHVSAARCNADTPTRHTTGGWGVSCRQGEQNRRV